MDVGKQIISLSVIVPEPTSGADSEDPPPDLLDIYHSKQPATIYPCLPNSMSILLELP